MGGTREASWLHKRVSELDPNKLLHIRRRAPTVLQIVKCVYNAIIAKVFVTPQALVTVGGQGEALNKALMTDKVFGLSVCGELGHKTKLPKTDEQG